MLLSDNIFNVVIWYRLLASENEKSHWLHLLDFPNVSKSHLFDFSPLCVFKCFLELLASENTKSHWLHLFNFPNVWKSSLSHFSPLCIFKCFLKLLASEKSYWLHYFNFPNALCQSCNGKVEIWTFQFWERYMSGIFGHV